jgi:hypothetical protein
MTAPAPVVPAFTVSTALDAGDFENRAPTKGIHADDEKYCDELICSTCGCRGLEYSPWYNARQMIYTAWAICPICGDLEQFQTPTTL